MTLENESVTMSSEQQKKGGEHMIQYNYSKLSGRMKEYGYTQESLSKGIGVSETTLNLSLNNKRNFKQDEMLKICELLHISNERLTEYFFTH